MKKIIMLLFCVIAFCGIAHSGPIPPVDLAPDTVLMPWENFSTLWDQARDKESERSGQYSYESACYYGRARIEKEDFFIHFTVLIKVTAFSNKDLLIPFLSNRLDLESLEVDGQESTWTEKNGFFQVYIGSAGQHDIYAKFTKKISARHWPRSFDLPLVRIPKSEIILEVPDVDVEAQFEPGVAMDVTHLPTGDRIRGYIPPVSQVNIRWLKENAVKKKVPVKMSATVNTYVSLEEKGAYLQSEIGFRILQGECNLFTVQAPDLVDILEVSALTPGVTISQWFIEKSDQGEIVHIYTPYQQNENFSVKIVYERTETKSQYRLSIPHIIPLLVERCEILTAVGSKDNVEITEETALSVERRDVRFLPSQIQRFSGANALYYYKALGEDHELAFSVKSHEKAPVATTRIKRVDAFTVLTKSGTVMTKVTYLMTNSQAQFFRMRLPAESRLLSAFLSGKEVQPAKDKDQYLIPVSKSANIPFALEIAFLTNSDKLGVFGAAGVALPESKLPIGELSWKVYTPKRFRVVYFGGNIQRKKYDLSTRLGWLLGELSDGLQNLAYAGEYRSNYNYSEKGLRKRFKKGWVNESEYDKIAKSSGNQVQVQIPVTGRRYSFESYLIKGFTPEIRLYFINNFIHSLVGAGGSLIIFVFVFWALALCLERKKIPSAFKDIKKIAGAICVMAVFALMLTICSLAITPYLWIAFVMAFFAFVIWQNRVNIPEPPAKPRVGMKIVFFMLLVMLMAALLSGAWGFLLFLCIASILVQKCLSLLVLLKARLKKRKMSVPAAETALMVIFGLCLAFFIASPSKALAGPVQSYLPKLKNTYLNLSWSNFEKLLKQVEEKQKADLYKLDEKYVFGNVNITGEVSEIFAYLKLSVPLSIISEDFVEIPLFSGSTAMSSAKFNGISVPLLEKNGMVWLEAKKESEGPGLLELELVVPVHETGGVNEFVLEAPIIRGGMVELVFGDEIKSVDLDGVAWQLRDGQKVRAALARSPRLRGELATFHRKMDSADEIDKRVKKTYSTTYTLISIEDEVVSFFSSIRYQILNDQVSEFMIQLPDDAVVHEIVGEDLEGWALLKTENNINTYKVKILYPVEERYDLSIQYEKIMKNSEDGFSVPNLFVGGVARDVGFLGVEMRAQAEISLNTKKLSGARVIDIQELPKIIRSDALAPFVYALRYVERPYEIVFQINKHPSFEMDPAIADRIQYTCIISPHGKTLAQMQMWIRNSRSQFAKFSLPKGATLMSTFLDGRSVKPSIGSNGELLLPLKRQSATPFVLDVVYEDQEQSLSAIGGRVRIKYPTVDIPASIVTSDIYFPKNTHFFSRSGDLQPDSVAGFIPWNQKSDVTGRSGTAITADMIMDGNREPTLNQEKSAEIHIQTQALAPSEVGGTHSLKIDLPKRGIKVSQSAFYVPSGRLLETGFLTCDRLLYKSWRVFSLFLLAAAGFLIPLFKIISPKIRITSIVVLVLLVFSAPVSGSGMIGLLAAGIVLGVIFEDFRKKQEEKKEPASA